jgi:hypothetical protein
VSANRQSVREQLAAMLAHAMPSAEVVYDHAPGALGSESPIVIVQSQGSSRPRMTFQGASAVFSVVVTILTLAAESADGAYTYAESADVVDQCEAELAAFVAANQENGVWSTIQYAGPSHVEFGAFDTDSVMRWREDIPLTITVLS